MTRVHKLFHSVVGLLFLTLAVVHAFRVIYGWHAVVNDWVVPISFSVIAIIVALYMAYWSLKTL